ncbi:hypothetical protein LP420_25575 [Massilia sp. B-10]|nr:hypothetical protein LP420_25575 [Massilia sp. B-10]
MKSTHPATARDYASPEIAFAESSLGEALLKLLAEGSVSNRAIADFLLRNQVRVTALGIEELAENCQVSTATISRFARELGFRNYAAMRNEIATTLQSVLQPVDKLRNNIARRSRCHRSGNREPGVCRGQCQGGRAGARPVRTGQYRGPPDRRPRRVRDGLRPVLAAGLSMLSLHLQPFCQQVIEVAGQGGTEVAASHLANITEDDVLVVISFPAIRST